MPCQHEDCNYWWHIFHTPYKTSASYKSTGEEKRKINVSAFEKMCLYDPKACQSKTVFDNKVQKLPVHNKAKISLKHLHVTGHIKWTMVLSRCMQSLTTIHFQSKEHKSGKYTGAIIVHFTYNSSVQPHITGLNSEKPIIWLF